MGRLFGMIAAFVLALACAAVARADDRPLPWAGGESVVSPFELLMGERAGDLTGTHVTVYCDGETDWNVLSGQGRFDPVSVYGYVEPPHIDWDTFQWVWPSYTHISPQACWHADRFWGATDKQALRNCPNGTRTEYTTERQTRIVQKRVRIRVKVAGKIVWRTVVRRHQVTETVQVPVQVPQVKICDEWVTGTLFSINTFAHETVHLMRVRDEAVAECFAMQTLAWWAWKLGATPEFARQMALDYWQLYYVPYRVGTSYGSYDCVNNGTLDLHTDSDSWPAGF